MRKLLSLALATCVLSMTSFAVSPGTALAEQPCQTPTPVGTEPQTLRVLGEEVHIPGVKYQLCGSPHGSTGYMDQWLVLRNEPGTCEASIYDPACFTLYLESNGVPHWTNFTLYTWIDGNPQEPVSIDIPMPIDQPLSICVLSVGYRTAPVHDCSVSYDLGQ